VQKVSFIIPLFNHLAHTRAMLASLQPTMPEGLAHEIILIDDGSTDGTREWLQTVSAPHIKTLLNPSNVGFAWPAIRGRQRRIVGDTLCY
jgi:glycosyltransferase involved in cell wall biosynthesis